MDQNYRTATIGAYALSFGRAKRVTNNFHLNRWINVVWLMVAWVVLQAMMGWLANSEGYALAIAAHIGGFAAGLLLQRPLLLWRYRKACSDLNYRGLDAGLRLRLFRPRDSWDAALEVGFEQAVEVDDHIFHLGIVDAALGFAAPGVFSRREAVVDADEINVIEVDEVEPARILDPPSEDQVKLAHRRPASRNRRGK